MSINQIYTNMHKNKMKLSEQVQLQTAMQNVQGRESDVPKAPDQKQLFKYFFFSVCSS